jgi:acetoin utilization deacetylase AcuC-like enzyme
MPPMPVVASDAHRGHDPPYEVNFGQVVRPGYERVARAELLRAALVDAGHPLVEPAPHGLEPVLAVHQPALVEFLDGAYAAWRAAGGPEVLIPDTFALRGLVRDGARELAGGRGRPGRFCFDTATPLVAGSYQAARAAADVALTGADLVAVGAGAAYALCRPPGHHAGPGYYGGFCLLNNAAIAATALRRLGRVAIVDVDFHHGNGTQEVFWEDPAVLYVSLHGDPARHYPHFTGAADETGGGPGRGSTRNLPLAGGTGDED